MADKSVIWTAHANFAQARREADQTRKTFERNAESERVNNKESVSGSKKTESAWQSKMRTLASMLTLQKQHTDATKRDTTEVNRHSVVQQAADAKEKAGLLAVAKGYDQRAKAMFKGIQAHMQYAQAQRASAEADRKAADRAARDSTVYAQTAAAREKVAQATYKQQEATIRAARAQDNYNKAMKGSDTDRQALSLHRLSLANLDLERANNRLGTSQRKLTNDQNRASGSNDHFFRGLIVGLHGSVNSAQEFFKVMSLLKLPAMGAGLAALAGAASALASSMVGLAGAVGPAVGALGAIPGAAVAGASAIGTLLLGFGGVGAALKQMGKAQTGASAAAAQGASQAKQTAQAIASAQQTLKNARQSEADQAEQSARSITDARKNIVTTEQQGAQSIAAALDQVKAARQSLMDAEKADLEAEKGIALARQAARQDIDDQRDSLIGLKLAQESSNLSLIHARQEYRKVISDPTSTNLDVRDAELNLKQAQYSVDQARKASQDAAKKLREEEKKGIKQSDEVVAARDNEEQADRAVEEAQKALAQSHKDVAQAQKDAAEQNKQAVQALADAQKQAARSQEAASQAVAAALQGVADAQDTAATSAAGAATGVDAFKEAMKKLSPEGRRFVRLLHSLKPVLDGLKKSAQSGLLPGVGEGLKILAERGGLLDLVKHNLFATGQVLGDFFKKFATKLTSPAWVKDLGAIMGTNEKLLAQGGDSVLNFADALKDVAVVAQPLTRWLGDLLAEFSEYAKKTTAINRANGDMGRFFEHSMETLELFGRIIGKTAKGLFRMATIGTESGEDLLHVFEEQLDKWNEWMDTVNGKNALKEWFEEGTKVTEALIGLLWDVGEIFVKIGEDAGTLGIIQQLRDELVPVLAEVFTICTEHLLPAVIDLGTEFLKLFEIFGRAGEHLVVFVESIGFIVKTLDWIITNIPGATQLLGLFFIAMAAFEALKFAGAITGISALGRAAIKVGKEQEGSAKGARALGIGIRTMSDNVQRASGTFNGAMTQMSRNLKTFLMGGGGTATNPVSRMDKISGGFVTMSKKIGSGLKGFAGRGGLSLAGAAIGMSGMGEAATKANKGLGVLTGVGMGAMTGSIMGPWGAAIGGAIGGLSALTGGFGADKRAAEEARKDGIDAFSQSLNQLTGATTQSTRELAAHKLEQDGYLKTAESCGISTDKLVGAIVKGGPALDNMNAQIDKSIAYAEGQGQAFKETTVYIEGQGTVTQTAAQAEAIWVNAHKDNAASLKLLKGALADNNSEVMEAVGAKKREIEATNGLTVAQERNIQKDKDGTTWSEKHRAALDRQAAAVQALIDKEDKAADAALARRDANFALQLTVLDAIKLAKHSNASIGDGTRKGIELGQSLDGVASAWNNTSAAAKNVPGAYAKARKSFIGIAEDSGLSEEKARKLWKTLAHKPENIQIKIQARYDHNKAIRDAKRLGIDVQKNMSTVTLRVKIARAKRQKLSDLYSGGYDTAQPGAATGGWIRGPGTGVSDSIPMRLSNGEFVVNAKAAQANAPILTAINEGQVSPGAAKAPGMAGGGKVGGKGESIFAILGINTNISGFEAKISRELGKLANAVKTRLKNVVGGFKDAGTGISKSLAKDFGHVVEWFIKSMKEADNATKKGMASISHSFQAGMKAADGDTQKGLDSITKAFHSVMTDLNHLVTGDFKPQNWMEQGFSQSLHDTQNWMEKVTKAFTDGLKKSQTAFEKFRDATGKIWDDVKQKVGTPVAFTVNTILNKGLIGSANSILKFLELKTVPNIPELKFAKGGHVPGHGDKDTVPAMLTPGEFVIKKKSAQKLGRKHLEEINGDRPSGAQGLPPPPNNGRGAVKADGGGGASPSAASDTPREIINSIGLGAINYGKGQIAKQTGGWEGYCQGFVSNAFTAGGWRGARPGSASAGWGGAMGKHTNPSYRDVPPGVPIFWTGGSQGYGHAAMSTGNGNAISTDYPTNDRVNNTTIAGLVGWLHNGHTWQGWAEGFGGGRVWTGQGGTYIPGAPGAAGGSVRDIGAELKKKFGKVAGKTAVETLENMFKPGAAALSKVAKGPMGEMIANIANSIVGGVSGKVGEEEQTLIDTSMGGSLDLTGNFASNKAITQEAARQMGWGDQLGALDAIIMHESGYNNTAQNPTSTAYGMFQFLDSTWATVGGHKTSDPKLQTEYGMRYIKNRYHDPNGAQRHEIATGWYARGGRVDGSGNGDTVPAMLTPGEFVINKKTAARVGLRALHRLNETPGYALGGPVKKKRRDDEFPGDPGDRKIQRFHTGGPVLKMKRGMTGDVPLALKLQEMMRTDKARWDANLDNRLRQDDPKKWSPWTKRTHVDLPRQVQKHGPGHHGIETHESGWTIADKMRKLGHYISTGDLDTTMSFGQVIKKMGKDWNAHSGYLMAKLYPDKIRNKVKGHHEDNFLEGVEEYKQGIGYDAQGDRIRPVPPRQEMHQILQWLRTEGKDDKGDDPTTHSVKWIHNHPKWRRKHKGWKKNVEDGVWTAPHKKHRHHHHKPRASGKEGLGGGDSGFSENDIERAKRFAKSKHGPYNMGGTGPSSYDCTGFVSDVASVLQGKGQGAGRQGATSSAPWTGSGWKTGLGGVMQAGWSTAGHIPGSSYGHMAGTIDGLNVESSGSAGPHTGSGARGATNSMFQHHMHLGSGSGTADSEDDGEDGTTKKKKKPKTLFEKVAAEFKIPTELLADLYRHMPQSLSKLGKKKRKEFVKGYKKVVGKKGKGGHPFDRLKELLEKGEVGTTKDFKESAHHLGISEAMLYRMTDAKGAQAVIKHAALDGSPEKQSEFWDGYRDFAKAAKGWRKGLQQHLGIKPAAGMYGPREERAVAHVLDHTYGRKHDLYADRPWQPLTAAEKAAKNTIEAYEKEKRFQGFLVTIASWGFTYLVDDLLAKGVDDGYAIAKDAAGSKLKASRLNSALKMAGLIAPEDFANLVKMEGFLASGPLHGLRDVSQHLGISDLQSVTLFENAKASKRLPLPAARLTSMNRDVSAYRNGTFYGHTGGQVPGGPNTNGGGDTVPAMLEPGEFVIRKKAARALGLDRLVAINEGAMGFAMGGLVPESAMNPGVAATGASTRALSGAMAAGSKTVNINTTINNPVAEKGTVSMNKMLQRKSRLGAFSDRR